MTKEDYLKELNNPESWFKQAFVQKLVADQLKDVIVKTKFPQIKEGLDHPDIVYLWGAALFHYAIGIENGLKGIFGFHVSDTIEPMCDYFQKVREE